MDYKVRDDPRELLSILNSIGIIGITSYELKTFMKDLKLCRKMKMNQCQQRKEDMHSTIVEEESYIDEKIYKSSLLGNHMKDLKQITEVHGSQILINHSNKFRSIDCIHDDANSDGKMLFSTSVLKQSGINPFIKELNQEALLKSVIEINELSFFEKNRLLNHKEKNYRKPPGTTGNVFINPASKHTSFIKRTSTHSELKKMNNKTADPVTLYNRYKSIWKQLSLPGEETHSKLRWSIRKKMFSLD